MDKGPAQHKEAWWWNYNDSNSVSEKHKLGNTSKEKYLEAKKRSRRAVYQAKCKAERKKFGNAMQQEYQKCDVFKIAKRMIKTNQGIVSEQ